MQQRQLRLGDILDDYCPRERRLTNHVVVAMVGDDVKQTRCTTCDADHEYKHAQGAASAAEVRAGGALAPHAVPVAPKKVVHEARPDTADEPVPALRGSVCRAHRGCAAVAPEPDASASRRRRSVTRGRRTPKRDADERRRPRPPAAHSRAASAHRRAAASRRVRRPTSRSGSRQAVRIASVRVIRVQRRRRRVPGNRSDGNMNGNTRGGPPRQHGGRPPVGPPRLAKRHGPRVPAGASVRSSRPRERSESTYV